MGKVNPKQIRLEASTVCQLKCPTCPTALGQTGKNIGSGHLSFENFKSILDLDPRLRKVELSNWGEILLNPALPEIIRYAHKKNVLLTASNGVNLNTVKDETLEALVKYRFRAMTCSIDGASAETYAVYRKNGSFETVIANIKAINRHKKRYRSKYPLLTWQFVAFGHNEHEIEKAGQMARELNMSFYVKPSWGDLHGEEDFSPVKDREKIGRVTGLGAGDRKEYEERTGRNYIQRACSQLWNDPQVNFDGKLLGCCINTWGDFGDALKHGLLESLNSEKMDYARGMLLGKNSARPDIPCTCCKAYRTMSKNKTWMKGEDLRLPAVEPRWITFFKNRLNL